MENTRKLEKINEVKRKFLKIINKIDKPLAQYIKIKKGGGESQEETSLQILQILKG